AEEQRGSRAYDRSEASHDETTFLWGTTEPNLIGDCFAPIADARRPLRFASLRSLSVPGEEKHGKMRPRDSETTSLLRLAPDRFRTLESMLGCSLHHAPVNVMLASSMRNTLMLRHAASRFASALAGLLWAATLWLTIAAAQQQVPNFAPNS